MSTGFIGIGCMGEPMALRLLASGVELQVWNRSPGRLPMLAAAGARVAASLDDLFAASRIVLLMLRGEAAVNDALGRSSDRLRARVAGRCIVQLGTVDPQASVALAADIHACGGSYVEAPVSGSRVPAGQGRLIGMVAGPAQAVARAMPLLETLCQRVFRCGSVGEALRLKLAVNHYLIAMVAALAEAVAAAEAAGVDPALLQSVLDAGPMSSEVSRSKLAKMLAGDESAHASIADVADIARRVLDQAQRAGAHAPLVAHSTALLERAREAGLDALDMCALRRVFAALARPTRADLPTSPRSR